MNFARNVKCLKCEEARPKRQLTGGEWECPQCDFFNYGRNPLCIRCDCKRPVDASFGITDSSSVSGHGNGLYANKPDIESRLAANEEKAQRWFTKASQLESAADLSNAAADEDFPEIMPLRKGVNRFVVSTRKTPLERRLANSQFQRDAANTGSSEILDANGQNAETASSPSLSRSTSQQFGHPKGSHSSYVPFVPLPKDMFAKNPEKIEENERVVTDTFHDASLKASEQTSTDPVKSETRKSGDNLNLTEQPSNEVEKSESWFKKLADLHEPADLESEISDDFPDIMPMRKGENRFVVSKKNSRSLSSPMYKRKMAMEQTSSTTNFVPFVPFPPDYFAKGNNQRPHGADSTVKATGETSSDSDTNSVHNMDIPQTSTGVLNSESSGENLNVIKNRDTDGSPTSGNPTQNSFNSQSSDKEDGWSSGFSGKESRIENTDLSSGENLNERKHITYGSPIGGNPTQNSFDSLSNKQDGQSTGFSRKERRTESRGLTGSSTKQPESQSSRSGWTGKSLEGSAVQEPDPLDMSEEAKAQRWFRRVAQIKDISELSQIPDEDFPSIMPMRKGVNRFVVSKRKTPLERRLTSPQYRRNLPVVSSDPLKKENENS